MRDRLIELIDDFCRNDYVGKYIPTQEAYEFFIAATAFADYLLANGVIVPPKVIGEKVWYVCDGQVQFTLIEGVEPALRLLGFPRPITRWEIGTLIFLTREEAEKALKGGVQG